MFRFNLKALMQLAKSEEGVLVRHARLECGKWSYLVCYALQDECLTIKRARRIRSGCTVSGWKRINCRRLKRSRRPRLHRFSQMWLQSCSDISCRDTSFGRTSTLDTHVPSLVDVASQTPVTPHVQAAVDTYDLCLQISRRQQTDIVYVNSTGCQTKCVQLERHSTQTEMELKSRSTQARVKPIPTSIGYTQTKANLMPQDRHTQTTYDEDVEELLRPYDKLFFLLLRSMTSQSNLLMRGVESINQLVDFKQLELKKQRQDAKAQESAQAAAKQLKLKQLQAHRAHKRMECVKRKIRVRPKLHAVTPTNVKPNDCCGTQTEQVSFSEAVTQTDRVKGFFFLRRRS